MKRAYESGLQDKFAELMSQNLSTVQIRHRLGLSNGQAQSIILRIRRKLGWQAK